MISVCLCDPQPVVREGLRALLSSREDMEVRCDCAKLEQAIAKVAAERPTIVILDRAFGMHPVLEAVAELRARSAETHVVIWASAISDVECFRALQAGARGIMKKTIESDALLDCLQSVAGGQLWTENLHAFKDSALERPRSRPLTPREQQVAALVAKGMKNREIAEALSIATGTVKIHLMHIFEKTGIRDRFELALQGLRIATERDRAEAVAQEEPITDPV